MSLDGKKPNLRKLLSQAIKLDNAHGNESAISYLAGIVHQQVELWNLLYEAVVDERIGDQMEEVVPAKLRTTQLCGGSCSMTSSAMTRPDDAAVNSSQD